MLKQPCWISGRAAVDTKGYKKVLLEERIPALKNVYDIIFKVIENTISSIETEIKAKFNLGPNSFLHACKTAEKKSKKSRK